MDNGLTTPKSILQHNNGAMVILENDEAYLYFLGYLMDGVLVISLDNFDDNLMNKNESPNVKCFYSPLPNGEYTLSTERRQKLWENPKIILDYNKKYSKAEREEIYKEAISKYGALAQQDIAIEEMSELTKALLKYRRAERAGVSGDAFENVLDNINEEIADVEIMIEQLKMMFYCDDKVKVWKSGKIGRLLARLKQCS